MSAGLGEAAAFGTALCWGVSSQIQGVVARSIGATGITLLRLPYQLFFLTIMCLAMRENLVLAPLALAQLAISGFLLVCCCDFALYRAMIIIGPPMALLILSLSTGFSALFGWLFLDESISLQAIGGIAVTLAGIAWVVTEYSGSILLPGQEIPKGKALAFGVFLTVFASVSLAGSFIFLKKALLNGVTPLWATLLRMLAGGLVFWTVGLFRGWIRPLARSLRANSSFYRILFFSSFCSSVGAWLASLAVHLAPVGIAATLIGLQPVMVTVIGALWYRKPPSPRAASGILIAFFGTALVCLR